MAPTPAHLAASLEPTALYSGFVVCGWLVYAGHSHTMHDANLLLRLVGLTFLIVLVVLLKKRKEQREFPFFFAYAMFSIIAAISRQLASGHPVGYFIIYWSAEIIYAVLALLVVREVFQHVF